MYTSCPCCGIRFPVKGEDPNQLTLDDLKEVQEVLRKSHPEVHTNGEDEDEEDVPEV